MGEFEVDDLIDKEYKNDEGIVEQHEINNIVANLQLYSDNVEMLTKQYTDILINDNVVYVMTRISQNQIFMKQLIQTGLTYSGKAA